MIQNVAFLIILSGIILTSFSSVFFLSGKILKNCIWGLDVSLTLGVMATVGSVYVFGRYIFF